MHSLRLVAAVISFALASSALAQDSARLIAQGSQRVIGGGCDGLPAPEVSGPLTIGSTMTIRDVGCFYISSPGSAYLLAFGIPLPPRFWLPIQLQQLTPVTCQLVILPAIVVGSPREPISLLIPNDPVLRGIKVGLQTYCFICGFRGCDQMLSQGVELTIG